MATREPIPADREEGVRPHRSAVVRFTLFAAGTVCVGLGVVGAFLPIVPTVPFLLLAAACYARSSERFYRMLLRSWPFGPALRSWRTRRCIPPRTKRIALACVAIAFGASAAFQFHRPPVAIALGAVGVLAFALVARIPTCTTDV